MPPSALSGRLVSLDAFRGLTVAAMILVNNRDEIPWEPGITVTRLLEICGYTSPHIHVFLDDELVQPPEYDTTPIPDGAEVRVLHMIAGG